MAFTFKKPQNGLSINKPVTGTNIQILPIEVENTTSATVTWNPTVTINTNGTGLTVVPNQTGISIPIGEKRLVSFTVTAQTTINGNVPPNIADVEISQVTADGTFETNVDVYLTNYKVNDKKRAKGDYRQELHKARMSTEALTMNQHVMGNNIIIFLNGNSELEYWAAPGDGGAAGTETWPKNTKFVSPAWRNRTPNGSGDYYDPIYVTPAKAIAAIKATSSWESQDWTVIVYNEADGSYPSDTIEVDERIKIEFINQATYAGDIHLRDKGSIAGSGNLTGTITCDNSNPLASNYGINYIEAETVDTLTIADKATVRTRIFRTENVNYTGSYQSNNPDFWTIVEGGEINFVSVNGVGVCFFKNATIRNKVSDSAPVSISNSAFLFFQNCLISTRYTAGIVTTQAGGVTVKFIGTTTIDSTERAYRTEEEGYADYCIIQVGGNVEHRNDYFPV